MSLFFCTCIVKLLIMSLAYANIDEAWGDASLKRRNKKKIAPRQDATCSAKNMGMGTGGSYDDIIETYLDEALPPIPPSQYSQNPYKINPKVIDAKRAVHNDQDYYDLRYNEQPVSSYPREKKSKANVCTGDVDGVLDNKMAEYSMSIEKYYDQNHMMFADNRARTYNDEVADEQMDQEESEALMTEEEYVQACRTTQEESAHTPASSYTNVNAMPSYNYATVEETERNKRYMYMEVIMYVFAGIIMIFILEQILQVGIHMSSRLS